MNEFLSLFLQPIIGTDSELLHLALAALAAIFSGVCAVGGVVVSFLVKRALTKWFSGQDDLRIEVEEIRRALEGAKERISTLEGRKGTLVVSRDGT